MPPYTVPVFNLSMSVWNWPAVPGLIAPPAPPTFTPIACQMYVNSRFYWNSPTVVLVRFAVDLTGNIYGFQDVIESPIGSGRYWRFAELNRIHEGFANEYWQGHAVKCDGAGAYVQLQQLP